VDLSTSHSASITRGCGLLCVSHAHRQGRALNFRCYSPLLRHIDLVAIRRILFSIDLGAFTALNLMRTSTPAKEHQNIANPCKHSGDS
jgi:hypothetical protein